MKKKFPLIIVFLLLTLNFSFAQLQNLVVLPEALKTAEGFSSLCINLFGEAPFKVEYEAEGGGKFYSESYYSVTPLEGNHDAKSPIFLHQKGTQTTSIKPQYRKFILDKIEEYTNRIQSSGKGFTEQDLEELQNEVWAYNGLDELGYIKQGLDPHLAYLQGAKLFSFRYGIIEDINPADFIIDKDAIVEKLNVLHEIKINGAKTPTVSNLVFGGNTISFNIGGVNKKIPMTFIGLQPNGILTKNQQAINTSLKAFVRDFKKAPEKGSISPANDLKYILTFRSAGSYGDYIRNFLIMNNTTTGKIEIIKELSPSYALTR
jgi:hypothetical protein